MVIDNKRSNIIRAWYLLYYTYGFLPIITGLDKYFDFLADWYIYLNLAIPRLLNITPEAFMHTIGVIEIIMGLVVFIRPRIGGYIIAAWLLIICINLISMGSHTHEGYDHIMRHYDVVVRDIVMAVGAYVLVLLSKELNK
ncbi:hypothetical protein HYX58_04285 [Candidatus Dependentiae bacterium]|nr:hypothetical protein [Candidatus Dependentiae bacterium]